MGSSLSGPCRAEVKKEPFSEVIAVTGEDLQLDDDDMDLDDDLTDEDENEDEDGEGGKQEAQVDEPPPPPPQVEEENEGVINDMAHALKSKGSYREAERLFRKALMLVEERLAGPGESVPTAIGAFQESAHLIRF